MIIINNEDWELPQIGKEPEIGYEYEYITKTVISGKVHRVYRGRRFFANISYAFLDETRAADLLSLVKSDVNVSIRTPFDTFSGAAQIEITKMPTRFEKAGVYDTWTEWKISIVGVNLIQ